MIEEYENTAKQQLSHYSGF